MLAPSIGCKNSASLSRSDWHLDLLSTKQQNIGFIKLRLIQECKEEDFYGIIINLYSNNLFHFSFNEKHQSNNIYGNKTVITFLHLFRCKYILQLTEAIPKKCSENIQYFTGEHPCWTVISIKLKSNFTEITFQPGYSPLNLQYIFRITFLTNTSRSLLFNWYLLRQSQR